ncbi:MAG: DUF2142 domain-containing protein [Pseudomonadales bacterium]|jgi:uncharacterized membrane protein|nr:DUF2142 domain-containing protein [Pseudomonadales bacterium]
MSENHEKHWLYFFKSNKNILIPIVIFLIGLVVTLFTYHVSVVPRIKVGTTQIYSVGEEINHDAPPTFLQNNQVVTQSFRFDQKIIGVGIPISKYSETLENAVFEVNVYDRESLLISVLMEFPEVPGGSLIEFSFDQYINSMDNNYIIEFIPRSLDTEDVFAVLIGSEGDMLAQIDGVDQLASLSLLLIFQELDTTFLAVYHWMFVIPLIIFLPVLWRIIFVAKAKPQKVFLISAIVFGALYMIVYTPYTAANEDQHIAQTFFYSDVIMGAEHSRDGWWPGVRVSWERRAEDSMVGFHHHSTSVGSYHHIHANFFRMANNPQETILTSTQYNGVFYQFLPQTIGVTIARFFGLGQIPTLYFGRFFSLATFIIVMYHVIKITPFKTLFCLLGLAPATLLIAGTFSYDTSITLFSYFFIAYVLHFAYVSKKMRLKNYAVLAILSLLIIPLKYVYMPLLLLPVILLPKIFKEKLIDRKKIKFGIIGVLLGILIALFIFGPNLLGWASHQLGLEEGFFHGTPSYTIGYLIFENPQNLFRLLSTSVVDNMGNLITATGGIVSAELPLWVGLATFGLFVTSVSPVVEEKKLFEIILRHKLLMLFIVAAIYVLFNIAGLFWTTIGARHIELIQGRYFIPILPLLVIPFYNLFKRAKNNDALLMFIIALINAYSILFIFKITVFFT